MTNSSSPLSANGIYVRGIVVSNRARAFTRKDGSGTNVLIEHELAMQPGMITWARYLDPKNEPGVKVDGTQVLDFPKLPEFQAVTIRAQKIRSNEATGLMTISQGEQVTS